MNTLDVGQIAGNSQTALILVSYLFILFGIFSIINQSVYFTYFWQLKEYRLDRMNDFLMTKSGMAKVFPKFWSVKMFLAVLTFLAIFLFGGDSSVRTSAILWVPILAAVSWLIEFGDFALRMKQKRIYRPDRTIKAILIVFLSVGILLAVFAMSYFYLAGGELLISLQKNIIVLWLISMAVFPLNALVIFLFWPITIFEKKRALSRAAKKIATMQGLRVIGITGSYGKSTTKDFLAAILESKFKVLKTPGNTNTDIGVAGVIMRDLKPEHEVFIVEAGAYKIGEIKKIVDLVKPRIGVITAVKDAHLGLFGSLENIKKAKYELIEDLPDFGTAIFNIDSVAANELAVKAEKEKSIKVLGYSAKNNCQNIIVEKEKVKFELENVKFELMTCGEQSISSALAAINVAREFGLKLEDMTAPLRNTKLREHTMTLLKVSADLFLIDDTYNANPDGVMAGLKYLENAYTDWQKIIVFPGMLELGEKSSEEHQRVAKEIAEVCDFAYFTSGDFEKDIMIGIEKANSIQSDVPFDFEFIPSNQAMVLAKLKQKIVNKKTVILFISRGSEQVIKGLL